jgi:hypothetical protein
MKRKNYNYALFDSNYLVDENISKCLVIKNNLKLARKTKKSFYPTAVIVKQEVIKSTIIP